MPFDWTEYLGFARFLSGINTGYTQEAAYRSAVSRAYYAAFCYARNFARDSEKFEPKYDYRDHQLLRGHFRNTRSQLSLQLDQLRRWRNDCDYKDQYRGLQGLVPSAINCAQEIMDELSPTP